MPMRNWSTMAFGYSSRGNLKSQALAIPRCPAASKLASPPCARWQPSQDRGPRFPRADLVLRQSYPGLRRDGGKCRAKTAEDYTRSLRFEYVGAEMQRAVCLNTRAGTLSACPEVHLSAPAHYAPLGESPAPATCRCVLEFPPAAADKTPQRHPSPDT